MALSHNPKIPIDSMIIGMDAINVKCYPGTGTTAYNLANLSDTFTLNSGVSYVSGLDGHFNFDGTAGAEMNITDTGVLNSWTVCYWFYHDSTEFDMTIGYAGDAGNRFYHRDDGVGGFYQLRVHNNSAVSVGDINFSAQGVERFQWAFVGYSMSGTVNGGTLTQYVNDVYYSSTSTTDDCGFRINNFGNPFTDSYRPTMKLGPLFVYNKALSQVEFLQLYTAFKGRFI